MSKLLDADIGFSTSIPSAVGSPLYGLFDDLFDDGRMPFVVWTGPLQSTSDPDEATRLISPADGAEGPGVHVADENDDDWAATSCCHLRTRSFARRARLRSSVLRRISLTNLPSRVCCIMQSLATQSNSKYQNSRSTLYHICSLLSFTLKRSHSCMQKSNTP